MKILSFLPALALAVATSGRLAAAGCEETFNKSGNPMSGTKYTAFVWVPSLSVADAVAQMHGVAVERKLDILSEEPTGSMLLEQRESFKARAIPYVVSISDEGGNAKIQLQVKLAKGVFSKSDDVRKELCAMLMTLRGGEEGKAAAQARGGMEEARQARKVDAFTLSMEISRQAKESAESIPLRYRERVFTVSGRVGYVIKNGNVYRVGFELPQNHNMAETAISCLMAPSQSAWAVALREGEKVRLTGTFSDYDQFRRVMWLGDCKPD